MRHVHAVRRRQRTDDRVHEHDQHRLRHVRCGHLRGARQHLVQRLHKRLLGGRRLHVHALDALFGRLCAHHGGHRHGGRRVRQVRCRHGRTRGLVLVRALRARLLLGRWLRGLLALDLVPGRVVRHDAGHRDY